MKTTSSSIDLFFENIPINKTTSYKYLGTMLDQSLLLNEQFDTMYKKASNRLRLLSKLRYYLTPKATKCVYQSLIQPILRYNCLSFLSLSKTRESRLKSLDCRVNNMIPDIKSSTVDMFRKHGVRMVHKCLTGDVCPAFVNYFNWNRHSKETRNRNLLLKVPNVKLEFTKTGFYFQGVRLFNSLPINVRKSGSDFSSRHLLSVGYTVEV